MSIIIQHGGETELEEEFCKIEQLLFNSIVLYQLKSDVSESDFLDDHMSIAPRVLERFLIVPRAQSMPVKINRDMTSGYWDYPITDLRKNEASIGFVHYYDYCGMDTPRRFEYVRGRILESSTYPEIVGKDLLVPADLAWIEDKKETEHLL
jgi:hypothetical protein